MKTVSKQYLVRVVCFCLLVASLCPSALSEGDDYYLPINKRCTESQIKQNLDDFNSRDRTAFASLAIRVCKEQATTILNNLLQDPDIDVRSLAAYGLALSGIDGPKAIPVLVEALKNGNAAVRMRSAFALGRIDVEWLFYYSDNESEAVYSQKVIPALRQALADKEPKVQFYAALALAQRRSLRKADLPVLIGALKDGDFNARAAAAEALGWNGKSAPNVIPALISTTGDQEPFVRMVAFEALGEVGKDNLGTVIPVLTTSLADSDLAVVRAAAEALRKFGPQARPAVPALITALRKIDNPYEATAIVRTLGKIGKTAVPQLIELLKENDNNLRLAAMAALDLIGPDAREALPLLMDVIGDPDPELRNQAIETLANFDEAVPLLIVELGSPDASRRTGAVAALNEIGPKATPKLAESLPNASGVKRAGIILALLHLDSFDSLTNQTRQKLVGTLSAAANDTDEVVRQRAVLALRKLKADDGSSVVPKTALTDEDQKVRSLAAEILIRTDPTLDQQTIPILLRGGGESDRLDFTSRDLFQELGKRAVPILIGALRDPDIAVRRNAVEALGVMEGEAEASIPSLLEALKDDDDSFRADVAGALIRISPRKEDLIPSLVSSLSLGTETGTEINYTMLESFNAIGRAAIPELIVAFEKSDSKTRIKIGNVLRHINARQESQTVSEVEGSEIKETPKLPGFEDDAKLAVPGLCQILHDKDPKVRSAAIAALDSVSVETNTVIPCLIEALGDDDETIRRQAASILRRIASGGTPEIIAALDNQNAFVRKGAAFALGNVKPLPAQAVSSLKKIVDNETEDLDVRRVAASTLEEAGLDMQQFFAKYNLVSPKDAACPTMTENHRTFHSYRFNTYSGRCELWRSITQTSGGGSLFAAIKRFFSGKKGGR